MSTVATLPTTASDFALDSFIATAEAKLAEVKSPKIRSNSKKTTPASVTAEPDTALIDADKAAKAADRRASRKTPDKKLASATAEPVTVEVKAEPVATERTQPPSETSSNVVEIRPGVVIVKPTEVSVSADRKLDKALTDGLKAIADKTSKAKADKKPAERGWKLPGGMIQPCEPDKLKPTQKGSIMDVIITLMMKGSTQAEFEAEGVGKGGNPFTYIRQLKGYGCRKEGDKFYIVFPEGVSEPLYSQPKVKAEKPAKPVAKTETELQADVEAAKARVETEKQRIATVEAKKTASRAKKAAKTAKESV